MEPHTVFRFPRLSETEITNYAGPVGELVVDGTNLALVLQTGSKGGKYIGSSTATAGTPIVTTSEITADNFENYFLMYLPTDCGEL